MTTADLPPGWAWVRLDEIAEVRLGRQRSPKNHSGDQMRPYLRAANVTWGGLDLSDVKEMNFTDDEVATYQLAPDDILLSEASGSADEVGKPAMWRGDWTSPMCFQNTLLRVRPATGVVPEYLHLRLLFEAVSGGFARSSRGVGIHHLGAAKLAGLEIALPPTGEQRRIAAALGEQLSRLDAVLRSLTRVRTSLRVLHRRTLTAAVRGEMPYADADTGSVTGTQLVERCFRERGGSQPAASGPWPLPPGWAWARIGDLFDVFVGSTPSRSQSGFWGGPVPWVSSGEVAFNRIRQTRETITEEALGNPAKRLHPAGTVMLAMIGEGRTRGQAAILDVAAAHNQNCASIRVPGSGVLSEWVYWCLAERYDRTRRQGGGNNQPALNKARVQEIELPIPPPGVQRCLVDRIEYFASAVAAASAGVDGLSARCTALRRALLHAASTGQLVPQGPNDEPAELLLKRVTESRAVAPSQRRGRARTVAAHRDEGTA